MTPRTYRSNVRAQAARSTREAILRSARTLFAEQGYARTSVAAIAEHAGVALNTVYTSVGAKPALIRALAEEGSSDTVIESALDRIDAETDGAAILLIAATSTAQVTREHADMLEVLLDNRTSEPAVDAVASEAIELYRARLARIGQRLETIGVLRDDLDATQAADVLWFYFGTSAWTTARELGWDWERATTWLHAQAVNALLSPGHLMDC